MKEEGKAETKESKAPSWKGISRARAWQRDAFTPLRCNFLLAILSMEGESSTPQQR